ncbi:MBL fold metallo-hydrolase [Paenisporosarcina sp.]|uniref:MBL fold metallo-hydrolase n=1 Tax=Paenisporosarcina sp. TaxID=1932001 RepID=UPI003C7650E2
MKKLLLGAATFATASTLFLQHYPAFGKAPNAKRKLLFNASPNFEKNKFMNFSETTMSNDLQTMGSIIRDYAKKIPDSMPTRSLPTEQFQWNNLLDSQTSVTWFGHSTVLLNLHGKTVFIDPMLGSSPSPFPQIGMKRYSENLPFDIKEIPSIDIVLYSHDHYDHLDYESVNLLKHKVGQFIVPLGVGSRLEGWGVAPEKIKELDWWDTFDHLDIQFTSTPARHFSGRSLFDHNSTLWSSWVIKSGETNIFYSGDSGYDTHFKEIGEKYGPFDFTMMECGQYDNRWKNIHMKPEETVQAHLDLKGKLMMPIHWSAFTLAFHAWTDPIERVTKAAKEHGVALTTPIIGQSVFIGSEDYPVEEWWKSV